MSSPQPAGLVSLYMDLSHRPCNYIKNFQIQIALLISFAATWWNIIFLICPSPLIKSVRCLLLGCQIQAGFVGGRAAHNWGYVVPGHGNASTNRVPMPNNNINPPSGPALPLPIRSPSSYYAQEHNITPLSLQMPFPQTPISHVYFFISLLGRKTLSLKVSALNGGE